MNIKIQAQCAGADNVVTLCDKQLDVNNQTFDLFSQLGGTPETGGVWSVGNPQNTSALDVSAGTVNLWAINRSGEHNFIYTNSSCGESATVTIQLGGYPGEDNISGGANACSDDISVNLFTFLDNELPNLTTDTNGTWVGIGEAADHLVDNIFNAAEAGVGIYSFEYSVNDQGFCTETNSQVILEVHRAPNLGFVGSQLVLCALDDLSAYTNVDLFDFLLGEDPNGIWSDLNGTGQITSSLDSVINIQEISDASGAGNYRFVYTVFPSNGVCSEVSSIVSFTIQSAEVAFGFPSENTYCQIPNGIPVQANYSFSPSAFSFSYNVFYDIIELSTGNILASEATLNINSLTPVFSANVSSISNPGQYQVAITNVESAGGFDCVAFTNASYDFTVYSPDVSTTETCFDKTDVVFVAISNVTDENGDFINGEQALNYTAIYNESAENIPNLISNSITFTNGAAQLPIDLNLWNPDSLETGGSMNLTFNGGANPALTCINHTFPLSFIPEDTISLSLAVDNRCDATEMQVVVAAQQLTTGSYVVTYEVIETEDSQVLISNTIDNFFGGNANFEVDISGLGEGNYEVIVRSVQDDTTPCREIFEFELRDAFTIAGNSDLPEIPDQEQSFCFIDFEPIGPTIADIAVESGENIQWYESLTATDALATNTVLIDGEDYFASARGSLNCEESERVLVNVSVLTTGTVTTSPSQIFCSVLNPTLGDVEVSTSNGGNVIWFDAMTEGNELPNTTNLQDGVTYYALERNGICDGVRTSFMPTVIDTPIPIVNNIGELCELNEPTVATLEEGITIADDFSLIWYDEAEEGNQLSSADALENNTNYYVATSHDVTGCEGDRLEIFVSLTNCSPEEFEFFIPDGFSPNDDGVNDTYYIPNIEFFYPNFEYDIFNRYGQLLFQGNAENPSWNGKEQNSSRAATSGVYFYIVRFNKDNVKPKQGRIYLSK